MVKFYHFKSFLIKIFLFSIQSLAIEMFKVINDIATTIIDDLFIIFAQNLSLLFQVCVQIITVKTLYCYGSLIWKYDSRLHKRFWKFTHIQRQNMKMKDHKLPPVSSAKKNIPYLGFINQIWFSIFAYNLVAYNLNVKGYFTLLVDARKMYSVSVDPVLRCTFQVLLFESCVIFIFCCK